MIHDRDTIYHEASLRQGQCTIPAAFHDAEEASISNAELRPRRRGRLSPADRMYLISTIYFSNSIDQPAWFNPPCHHPTLTANTIRRRPRPTRPTLFRCGYFVGTPGRLGVGHGRSWVSCDTTMTNVLHGISVQENEAECDGDPRDYGTDIAFVLPYVFFFKHNSINAILYLFENSIGKATGRPYHLERTKINPP